MKKLIILFFITLSQLTIAQTPNGSELVKVNIQTLNTGSDNLLAITLENAKEWHTYWINPGDAGLPTEIKFFESEKEINLEPLEWPVPKKYLENGDMLTFGYSKDHTFFFKIGEELNNKNLSVDMKWLICKNICIPGERKLDFQIKDGKVIAKNEVDYSVTKLQQSFAKVPTLSNAPDDFDINLIKYKDNLALFYNFKGDVNDANPNLYILTPHPTKPFSFKREIIRKDKKGNHYGIYTIEWDGEYLEPEIPLPTDGKFKTPYTFKFLFNDPVKKKVYTIEKTFSEYLLNEESNLQTFFSGMKKIDSNLHNTKNDKQKDQSTVDNKSEPSTSSAKLLYFFIMAFIGGLILNIMPCVLPVISIKLFGLISHSSQEKKSIFKHNMAYSLGVIMTFIALATVVSALKATGEQVGWGFQLQSPIFVAAMATIIFIMALNMFGLFEFRTPGGSKLGSVKVEDSFAGDVFGGVLATILSTPCSAPFLGTALTFAFGESPIIIFLIFISVGLGLAFPFILTAIFPSLIKFLPKPGMWMEHVKKFLGFTLILTTLWLLDVFLALTDSQLALLQMNTALALLFFFIYIRSKITKNIILGLAVIIPASLLYYKSVTTQASNLETTSALLKDKSRSELQWEAWSEERMQQLQDNKSLTFIDFTAKWCLTCKVNEKVVLDTHDFKELVKKKDIKLLLADWTRRDPIIGKWLQKNGFVGVPAYFVINSDGELVTLGETITVSKISKALN